MWGWRSRRPGGRRRGSCIGGRSFAAGLGLAWAVGSFLAGCGPPKEDSSTGAAFPAGPLRIALNGQDYAWEIAYRDIAGARRKQLQPPWDGTLKLPAESEIEVTLTSGDYLYMFELPRFNVRETAVPGLEFRFRFRTGPPGRWKLLGNQMCGYLHPDLLGTVQVMEPEAFRAWLKEQE